MALTKWSTAARIRQHPGHIRDVLLSFAGVLLFAGFIHRPFPLSLIGMGGLALCALVMVLSTKRMTLREAFGISRFNRKILLFSIQAFVLGGILGIFTRNHFELSFMPAGLTGVAVLAPLIGATEELMFRGYIQGHLRPAGRLFSIITATTMHTSYKFLVILTLAIPLQFDFFFLIFWTFIGGLLFGILRELSGNTFPPLIAHAVFDVVLYGGMTTAPVWVWS